MGSGVGEGLSCHMCVPSGRGMQGARRHREGPREDRLALTCHACDSKVFCACGEGQRYSPSHVEVQCLPNGCHPPPCEPDTPGTTTLQPSPGLNQHASMTSWDRPGGVAGPGRREPRFTEAAELAPPGCADEGKTLRLRCVRNLHEMCATLEKEPMFVSRSALQRVRKLRDRFLKTWSLLHQRTLSQGSGLTQPHR
jgi:hypothetical protein